MSKGEIFGLEGKVVIVTGGNHGIGASIVKMLYEDFGCKIAYNYRKETGLEGTNILPVQVDVTDNEGMEDFVERVEKDLGPVYGVVANAGVIEDVLIDRMTIDQWRKVIDIDLTGAYNTVRPVLPRMKSRYKGVEQALKGELDQIEKNLDDVENQLQSIRDELKAKPDEARTNELKKQRIESQGRKNALQDRKNAVLRGQLQTVGSIVFISSLGGQRGNIGQANYAAAKAGLIGLAETIALEASRYGVRSNVVAPGYTRTDVLKGIPGKVEHTLFKEIPLNRFAEPEEMAWATSFLLSPIASSYISGQTLAVNGGQYW